MTDVATIKRLTALTNTRKPYTSDALIAARMMVPMLWPGEIVPRFAAIKSTKFAGKYVVLGGGREPGETSEYTARREAFEEGGIVVHDALWLGDQPIEQPFGNGRWVACYLARRWSYQDGQTHMVASSEGEPFWVPAMELMDDSVSMFTNGNAVSLMLVTAWAKAQPRLPCDFGVPVSLDMVCGI